MHRQCKLINLDVHEPSPAEAVEPLRLTSRRDVRHQIVCWGIASKRPIATLGSASRDTGCHCKFCWLATLGPCPLDDLPRIMLQEDRPR